MSPFYPPGSEPDEPVRDKPYFASLEDLARHQAENLRQAIGDELYEWLEKHSEEL